jgi:hypothetical protein
VGRVGRLNEVLWQFGVDQERHAATGDDRQRLAQVMLVDARKFVDARRRQKTFEAADARVDEGVEVAGVAGDDAAPESDVDVASRVRRRALRLQRIDGRRGRHAVERHVDDRRHAARRRGPRRGVEAFPGRASGLVDVDVGVDDAGRHDEIARVVKVGSAGHVAVLRDAADSASFDVDRRGFHAVGHDDAAASNDHAFVTIGSLVSGTIRSRAVRPACRSR